MKFEQYYQKTKSILGLSLSLAKVKFKLRNEGSYIGIFWYLLNPLAMFMVLLFLGNLINKKTTEYYPVYLLLGLIMFNLFTRATNSSTNSIYANAGLLKSSKVNQESFVISDILNSVFSHIFEILILMVLMVYFKISLIGVLFYPIILFFLIIFISGFAFILSSAGVFVTDLSNAWSIFANLAWFTAPVYYVVSKGDTPFFNKINPMFYFITVARDIVIYRRVPESNMIFVVLFCTVLFFVLGLFIFEKFKKKFAENI